MGNVTIKVTDTAGNPITGAEVLITWNPDALGFGGGTDAGVTTGAGTITFSEPFMLWPANGTVDVTYNGIDYGETGITYWDADVTQTIQVSTNLTGAAQSWLQYIEANVWGVLSWLILLAIGLFIIWLVLSKTGLGGAIKSGLKGLYKQGSTTVKEHTKPERWA